MKARIWLGEDSSGLFLEDLREDKLQLTDYGQTYEDRETQNQIRILESMLSDAGWISKFRGSFEFINGVWTPRRKRGHFVVGKKVLTTSVYEKDGKAESFPSGTHVYINNHPVYAPGGIYLTTFRDTDREYHLHTKSLEKRMTEQGGIPPRARIELIGSEGDDTVWRIFQTYVDPFHVNPGYVTKSPPLFLYELVA